MTDDWVWDRVKYWWSLLNQKHNRHFDIPTVEITDRNARKAGYCSFGPNPTITLYEYYLNRYGEKYDQTIGHELVHAHNFLYYGKNTGHTSIWKNTMRMVGLNPAVYHNYEPPNRHKVLCKCGQYVHFGPTQLKRMRNGTSYRCRNCGTAIRANSQGVIVHG